MELEKKRRYLVGSKKCGPGDGCLPKTPIRIDIGGKKVFYSNWTRVGPVLRSAKNRGETR
jgi:hypothetical protein